MSASSFACDFKPKPLTLLTRPSWQADFRSAMLSTCSASLSAMIFLRLSPESALSSTAPGGSACTQLLEQITFAGAVNLLDNRRERFAHARDVLQTPGFDERVEITFEIFQSARGALVCLGLKKILALYSKKPGDFP